MPDEIIAEPTPTVAAPEPVAAAAPPEPTPAAASSNSTSSLIAEMESLGKPESAKVAEPPTNPTAKLDSTAPKPSATTNKEKDPVSLRKRLAEIEQEYSGFKLTATQEREKLSAKIAEFEKRKYLTPEQEQQQSFMENRLKQVEAEFYARDYKESPEFKSEYEGKWQSKYKQAMDEISTISIVDDNGDTRVANRADFDKVRNAVNGVERRRLAKQIFGEDSDIVIDHVSGLSVIQDAAQKEIETRKSTYDSQVKQARETNQRNSEVFNTVQSETENKLREKWPQYFGEDPNDKESSEALKRGLDFVNSSLSGRGQLPTEDVATRAAIIKNWASAFPRLVLKLEKSTAEITALKEQLSKIRGSDPGSSDGGASVASDAPKSGGINSLIAQFEE